MAQLRRELAELRKHNEKLEREAKMHNGTYGTATPACYGMIIDIVG